MGEFEVYVARFAHYIRVQIYAEIYGIYFSRRFVYFHRYFQRKLISIQTIVLVLAGTSGPDETRQWAGYGPRAVNCIPLVQSKN